MDSDATKRCFKCGEVKAIREGFYKHPRMADGHLNKCKECTKRDSRNVDPVKRRVYEAERSKRPERLEAGRLYNRAAYAADPARFIEKQRRDRKRWPEKNRARKAVSRAIASGRLVRQPCEVCGATNVQAHHPDYSKPLEVRWLCPPHHGAEHSHGSKEKD